jgi:hypothetical protein
MSVGTGIGGDPGGDAKGTYEELFPYELKRQHDGKGRSQCWGTNYRSAIIQTPLPLNPEP